MPDACLIRVFTCFEQIGAQARLHFRRKNSYEMNQIGFNGSTVLTLLAVFCRIQNGPPWLRSGTVRNLRAKNIATLNGKTQATVHILCLRLRWNCTFYT